MVVDEDTRSDVHGVDKAQPFTDTTFFYSLLHLRCYMNKVHSRVNVECQVFSMAFHGVSTDGMIPEKPYLNFEITIEKVSELDPNCRP